MRKDAHGHEVADGMVKIDAAITSQRKERLCVAVKSWLLAYICQRLLRR